MSENYATRPHAGLSIVIGHPFTDQLFYERIQKEQEAIQALFEEFGLADALVLYKEEQLHATILELASQHDPNCSHRALSDEELTVSGKTNSPMDINFAAQWIQRTQTFSRLGSEGTLSLRFSVDSLLTSGFSI